MLTFYSAVDKIMESLCGIEKIENFAMKKTNEKISSACTENVSKVMENEKPKCSCAQCGESFFLLN